MHNYMYFFFHLTMICYFQNKELAYAHVSDSQMEKYEEILKCKDDHIKDLENKVRELQKHVENVQNEDTAG